MDQTELGIGYPNHAWLVDQMYIVCKGVSQLEWQKI